jgi:hypothetical protein
MAARAGVGLSDADVDRLREQLTTGGKPRVRVSGPQFADQPTGTVLAVGTPETDGDDFVTVRVKAGGVTDELRFSPRELTTVGRGAAPARAAERPGSGNKRATAEKAAPADPTPGGAKRASTAKPARSAKSAATPTEGRRAAATAPLAPKPAGGGRRRGASLPTVSVTLASAGASWSVSAQRGARTVVKNAPVPPGVVSAVAELLGLPAVGEAVAAVNDAALQEAEARAAALRAELSALEAELDSHRRP